MDLAASKEHLRYTITLAGVGFAYCQTRLGVTDELFGREKILLEPQTILVAMLALFFASALFAIFAYSGIIRQLNEDARYKSSGDKQTLSASRSDAGIEFELTTEALPEPPTNDPNYAANRDRRLGKIIFCTNWHLYLLIGGFLLAAIFFVGEALNPERDHATCNTVITTTDNIVLSIEHECDAISAGSE